MKPIREGDQIVACIIILKRVPAEPEDAVSIAHEFTHILLLVEGFPDLVPTNINPEYGRLDSILNTAIQDALVESRLYHYGFDMKQKYEKEMQFITGSFGSSRSPNSWLDRMTWRFTYVEQVLNWLELQKRGITDVIPARDWFKARFPDIAQDGDEVLALVDQIGLDTPQKMNELFRAIISKHALGPYLRITNDC